MALLGVKTKGTTQWENSLKIEPWLVVHLQLYLFNSKLQWFQQLVKKCAPDICTRRKTRSCEFALTHQETMDVSMQGTFLCAASDPHRRPTPSKMNVGWASKLNENAEWVLTGFEKLSITSEKFSFYFSEVYNPTPHPMPCPHPSMGWGGVVGL